MKKCITKITYFYYYCLCCYCVLMNNNKHAYIKKNCTIPLQNCNNNNSNVLCEEKKNVQEGYAHNNYSVNVDCLCCFFVAVASDEWMTNKLNKVNEILRHAAQTHTHKFCGTNKTKKGQLGEKWTDGRMAILVHNLCCLSDQTSRNSPWKNKTPHCKGSTRVKWVSERVFNWLVQIYGRPS